MTSLETDLVLIKSRKEGIFATILIGAGEYHETVNVTRSSPLTLLVSPLMLHGFDAYIHSVQGQLPTNTILNTSANATALNLVHIWNNTFVQTGMDDADSAVLVVSPNRAGSLIGSGPTGAPLQPKFGNIDFKAYNIDFENRAVRHTDDGTPPPIVLTDE
jgi:hypothetical protein